MTNDGSEQTRVSLWPLAAAFVLLFAGGYILFFRIETISQLLNRLRSEYSGRNLPPVPVQSCHPFRLNSATYSG